MRNTETCIRENYSNQSNQYKKLMAAEFRNYGIAVFEEFLPPLLIDSLHREANELLESSARRRDMLLATSGGTPRAYTSVDRYTIFDQGNIIKSIFASESVRKYISEIAGEPIYKVPYQPEEYIINSQEKSGDTHGWHWDDYTFALIWVVQAPDQLAGGRVEYVVSTDWDKNNPQRALYDILSERVVKSKHISSGCCYLMRANTTLHRVAPLMSDTRRTVIVFTYASESDLSNANISHESMEQIYSEELEVA